MVGPEARDGMRKGVLRAHIDRIRPSVLVLLLPSRFVHEDGNDPKKYYYNPKDMEDALGETLDTLKKLQPAPTSPIKSLPVYLVVNKCDRELEELYEGQGADKKEEQLLELNNVLRSRVFDLRPYLDAQPYLDTQPNRARLRLRNDANLTNVAVRRLLLDTFARWEPLIDKLREQGFTNVCLAFTCSLPREYPAQPASGAEKLLRQCQSVSGVEALWRHLLQHTVPLFSKALKKHATQMFVSDLRDNANRVTALLSSQ